MFCLLIYVCVQCIKPGAYGSQKTSYLRDCSYRRSVSCHVGRKQNPRPLWEVLLRSRLFRPHFLLFFLVFHFSFLDEFFSFHSCNYFNSYCWSSIFFSAFSSVVEYLFACIYFEVIRWSFLIGNLQSLPSTTSFSTFELRSWKAMVFCRSHVALLFMLLFLQ